MLWLTCMALMSPLLTFRRIFGCNIWQLCVSPGRAGTMATPSNEHLLKGWAPLSLFYLLPGYSPQITHNSQLGDREDDASFGFSSATFFIFHRLPICFWNFVAFATVGHLFPLERLWDFLAARCPRPSSGRIMVDAAPH